LNRVDRCIGDVIAIDCDDVLASGNIVGRCGNFDSWELVEVEEFKDASASFTLSLLVSACEDDQLLVASFSVRVKAHSAFDLSFCGTEHIAVVDDSADVLIANFDWVLGCIVRKVATCDRNQLAAKLGALFGIEVREFELCLESILDSEGARQRAGDKPSV